MRATVYKLPGCHSLIRLTLAVAVGAVVAAPAQAEPSSPKLAATPEELEFSDPGVAKRFRLLAEVGHRTATDDWIRSPFDAVSNSEEARYELHWKTRDRIVLFPSRQFNSDFPIRSIQLLSHTPIATPRTISDFHFRASKESKDDWSVFVWYAYEEKLGADFSICFYHPDYQFQGYDRKYAICLPQYDCSAFVIRNDIQYSLELALLSSRERRSIRLSDKAMLQLYETAQSFRDSVLGEIELLRRRAEQRIAGNDIDWFDLSIRSTERGVGPPRNITEDDKRQLLAQINAKLEQRQTLVEDNYRAMHAALNDTFPLGRVLSKVDP